MELKKPEQLVTLDDWKTYARQLEQQVHALKQEVEAIETRGIAELNDLIQQSASEALVQQMFRDLEETSEESEQESWFALLDPPDEPENPHELTREAAEILLQQVFELKPEFRYLQEAFLAKLFNKKEVIPWCNGTHYRNLLQRKKEYVYETPFEAMDEMIKDFFIRL